jgi:hypothetical protein
VATSDGTDVAFLHKFSFACVHGLCSPPARNHCCDGGTTPLDCRAHLIWTCGEMW